MNKKAYEIGDLLTYGLMFVILTVALSFGATILGDLRNDQLTTQNVNASEESHTTTGDENHFGLTYYPVISGSISVVNETIDLNKGNITEVTLANGTISLNVSGTYNFSYLWLDNVEKSDYNISTYGLTAILNLANWTPNLATIIIAAVIIGILMTAFVYKNLLSAPVFSSLLL